MSNDETLWGLFFSKPKDLQKSENELRVFDQNLKAFEKEQKSFHVKVLKLPLNLTLIHWLKSLSNKSSVKRHSKHLVTLIEEKLIADAYEMIEVFIKRNTSHIFEKIRAHQKIAALEKESLCETFQIFLNYLNRLFQGAVDFSGDPVQILTRYKKISHTQFIRFIEPLSKRDQLIAKVLYYGEPTLEETLELTSDKILFKQSAIQFRKNVVSYPKHVIQELKEATETAKTKGLVFTNQKGNQIERPHLNNCFARAAQQSGMKGKITPKDLLESRLPTGSNDLQR